MPSVIPTVAVESAPRCATKKISTMPKSDSIAISSTMGTASSTIARSIEIAVKSCLEPSSASLNKENHLTAREETGVVTGVLKKNLQINLRHGGRNARLQGSFARRNIARVTEAI